MRFADYDFYQSEFGGTKLTEADFTRLIGPACAYVDNVTFGRAALNPDRDEIRRAACAAAETMQLNEQGGGVVSETVGRVTRNYAAGISNTGTDSSRLYTAAALYLGSTGLMYRGC